MVTAVTTARTPPPARSIARAGLFTVAATGSTLLVNLATGILIARVAGALTVSTAVAQFTAAAVTVAGLLLLLRSGGIEAAAIVSTVAYALVFVIAVLLHRRTAGPTWREPGPSVMATWFGQPTRGALGRA